MWDFSVSPLFQSAQMANESDWERSERSENLYIQDSVNDLIEKFSVSFAKTELFT